MSLSKSAGGLGRWDHGGIIGKLSHTEFKSWMDRVTRWGSEEWSLMDKDKDSLVAERLMVADGS